VPPPADERIAGGRTGVKRVRANSARTAPQARAEKGRLEQQLLVLVTLGLVAFGLVMVYSATSASAAIGNGNPMRYLVKQVVYASVGFVALMALSRLDYHRLRVLAQPLLGVAFFLCVAVLVAGPPINGARRWFIVGPVSFQPSELAKIAICVWVAAYLARRAAPRTLGTLFRPVGLVTLAFAAVVVIEPDLGTTIAICVMVMGILFVSGVSARLMALTAMFGLAVGAAAIWLEPYRRERFFTFLDPSADPQGAGYQTLQAIIGMGSGGLTGKGIGQGVQKVSYLPEAHTDMIFATIGEELGLIGSVLVIGAFAAFAWAGFRVALRARDPFGKRLAAGITTLVCGQAAVNLMAVLGIAPLTGIPLPFVSYGGSSLLVLLAAVGILLNIAVNERVVGAEVRDRGRRDSRPRSAGARRR
jgi:cell division protein FtsW